MNGIVDMLERARMIFQQAETSEDMGGNSRVDAEDAEEYAWANDTFYRAFDDDPVRSIEGWSLIYDFVRRLAK